MYKIEHIVEQNKINDAIKSQVILYKGEAFTFFNKGLTRYVFANKNKTKVIKLCIEQEYDWNKIEAEIYNNASEKKKSLLAKTKLTTNGMIIEQEFCNPIKFDNRELTIPEMLFAGKCRNEVGWNSEGKLVCFDLDEFHKW